jgi:long-chain fatty acid transport protein
MLINLVLDMKFLKLILNAVYHNAASDGGTEGPIYNPMLAGQTNPLGRIRIVKFPIKWIQAW